MCVPVMNVSVDSPIIIFRDGDAEPIGEAEVCSDYLRSREIAERAAAENSPLPAARKLHLQLAESYAARRRGDRSQPLTSFGCDKES
jgi:hypothetical protein